MSCCFRSGSPGNVNDFEEELMQNESGLDIPIVMSITLGYKEGQRTVGIACVNNSTNEIGVNEFADDDGYRNVECMFVQLGVKECICPKV